MSSSNRQKPNWTCDERLSRYSSAFIKRGLTLAKQLQLASSPESLELATQTYEDEMDGVVDDLFLRGIANYELGNRLTALEYFNKALQINPNHINSLCFRGFSLDDLNDNQAALKDFRQILEISQVSDASVHILYAKSIACSLLNDSSSAQEYLVQALQINPAQGICASLNLFLRGSILYLLGDKQGAATECTQALHLNLSCVDALRLRGIVRCELGDEQGAMDDLTQALELNQNHSKASLTFFFRGMAQQKLKNSQEADNDYTQALQLNPNFAEAQYNRAVIRGELGDLWGAIADLNQVLQSQPENANAYFFRGAVHQDLGNFQSAIEDYTRAIQLMPNLSQAYYNRACVYQHLGNTQSEIEDYTVASQLNQVEV
jgi:tetratricopeptide (TPR) repeat protein